jgi:hypothetical protein
VKHHRPALAPEQAAVNYLATLLDDQPDRQDAPEVAVERQPAELIIGVIGHHLWWADCGSTLVRRKGFDV